MQNGYGRLKGRLLEVFRAVMKTGQVTRASCCTLAADGQP